ncbi:MAG: hypothetical protein J6X62_07780 [Bacteroidales bacterium]|nr:hypothetical protein [Bacteroidales bacterium]
MTGTGTDSGQSRPTAQHGRGGSRQWRQWRSFVLIFGGTLLLWVAVAMTDEHEYLHRYRVEYSGYDTVRYAMTQADTVLELTWTGNGFYALRSTLGRGSDTALRIDVSSCLPSPLGDEVAVTLDDAALHRLVDPMLLSSHVSKVVYGSVPLRVHIASREKRRVPVRLRDAEFSFANQYGLAGEPTLEPDSLWVYGSRSSLEHIAELYTAPCRTSGINRSSACRIKLDASWRQYRDVRVEADEVEVYLPVARFVERKFTVPVRCDGGDSLSRVRLYPDKVDVVCWIPQSEYRNVSADDITAVVTATHRGQSLPVRVTHFPQTVRIKSVTPSEIQYVIIK